MGETTKIAWTQATWNPWIGCRKVSPGCDHCYAERDMTRYGRDFGDVHRTRLQTFTVPLRWKEPRLIFTCSWSDFFIRDADGWRDEALEIIRATPQHTYQILTKRPERMREWSKGIEWPPNVWLGVSVESQKFAYRLDVLTEMAVTIRFVSAEPLLGPLDLTAWLPRGNPFGTTYESPQGIERYDIDGSLVDSLDWVIAGGESGPNFRHLNLDWVRSLRDQCKEARIPFFYKQGSGLHPVTDSVLDDREWRQIPEVTDVVPQVH